MGVGLGAFLILGTLCVADSAEPSALAPGMDFSSLSSSAQAALATVLSDGFCPCLKSLRRYVTTNARG